MTLATATAYDLHFRLLPQLREIARLASSAPAARPARRRSAAGGSCCAPTAGRPRTGSRQGISETELRALVADLERM